MVKLIVYAWVVTVLFVIALNAAKGKPILHAFGPMPNRWISVVVFAGIVVLILLEFKAAAMAVMLGYASICIWRALGE